MGSRKMICVRHVVLKSVVLAVCSLHLQSNNRQRSAHRPKGANGRSDVAFHLAVRKRTVRRAHAAMSSSWVTKMTCCQPSECRKTVASPPAYGCPLPVGSSEMMDGFMTKARVTAALACRHRLLAAGSPCKPDLGEHFTGSCVLHFENPP